MATVPTDVLGPLGALVGLIIVATALWKAHLDSDKDLREQRDKAQHDRDKAIEGWRAQASVSDRLANATELRNRRDAAAKRAEDKP